MHRTRLLAAKSFEYEYEYEHEYEYERGEFQTRRIRIDQRSSAFISGANTPADPWHKTETGEPSASPPSSRLRVFA
jgi:hypothetical protein